MVTLVQHTSSTTQFTSGSSGTASATFSGSTASGNCLVAAFTIQQQNKSFSISISSVKTGTNAENWASVVQDTSGETFSISAIWADPSTAGGATTVNIAIAFGATASTSETISLLIDLYEVSGIATSSPADKTSSHDDAGTGSTTWTSNATATTTNPIEFWVGVASGDVVAANTTTTVTGPGGSWTNETTLSSSVQNGGTGTANKFFTYQLSGFQITSSTGTATYNGTFANASFWSACVATLLSAPVGPAIPPPAREVRAQLPSSVYVLGNPGLFFVSTRDGKP